jgi:hypothetical protein
VFISTRNIIYIYIYIYIYIILCRYKLLGGLAVRRACYGVVRFVMESGAKGCEVIVSGKLRAQRAKAMKFKDGYFVSSGEPARECAPPALRSPPPVPPALMLV